MIPVQDFGPYVCASVAALMVTLGGAFQLSSTETRRALGTFVFWLGLICVCAVTLYCERP